MILRPHHGQGGGLGVGYQAVAVHGHRVRGTEVTHVPRFLRAGGNFGHGDILKNGPQRVGKVEIVAARAALVPRISISFVPPPPGIKPTPASTKPM